MRRFWIVAIGVTAAAISSASLAFEEQKLPAAKAPPQSTVAPSATQPGAGLAETGLKVQRIESGTKIRVPGLGVIGEIPKMDFGLELLYGASQPKSSEMERGEGNGVMGRVTVPIKPSR